MHQKNSSGVDGGLSGGSSECRHVIYVHDVIQTCSTAVSTVVVNTCYANLALGYLQDMKANLEQEQWGRNNGTAN